MPNTQCSEGYTNEVDTMLLCKLEDTMDVGKL